MIVSKSPVQEDSPRSLSSASSSASLRHRKRRANDGGMLPLQILTDYWERLPVPLPSLSPTRTSKRARNCAGSKRKVSKNMQRLCFAVFDLLVMIYLFKSLQFFLFPAVSPSNSTQTSIIPVPASSMPNFQTSHNFATPVCDEIDADDVSVTLAIHLSENKLWMMKHHCELWGVSSPISVAIWTQSRSEDLMEQLHSMGCDIEHLKLQTLNPSTLPSSDYPINILRNLALSVVETSHVLILDVDFWASTDLFDTLHAPSVRANLAADARLGIVVPAFELQDAHCHDTDKCRENYRRSMPKDFEDLVLSLTSSRALPYDPTNFPHQGSTDYRKWMRQGHSELMEISCVGSDEYQPYVVVRLCDNLPPFQNAFYGHGHNHMAWMLHLRRSGFKLQQLGGSFLTHFPHQPSPWTRELTSNEKGLRGTEELWNRFVRWLDENVADNTRLPECDQI